MTNGGVLSQKKNPADEMSHWHSRLSQRDQWATPFQPTSSREFPDWLVRGYGSTQFYFVTSGRQMVTNQSSDLCDCALPYLRH